MQHEFPGQDLTIRRLWRADLSEITAHFLRLDPETRRLRFGTVRKDEAVRRHARETIGAASVDFGAFAGARLRGLAELRGWFCHWPPMAEAAFSVEREWQDAGIGEALFDRLVAAAQNRGIRRLYMICLRENGRMQHLARKHDALLEFDIGEVEARLHPPDPTPYALSAEFMGETRSFARTVLRLPA